MKWEYLDNCTGGLFVMKHAEKRLIGKGVLGGHAHSINTFVVNKGEPQQVWIDEIAYTMPKNSVLPLVSNQYFVFDTPQDLLVWQFNREFYCIVDHDAEVGCVGFLFYGIHHPMFVSLDEKGMEAICQIEKLFLEDLSHSDRMQGEMLRTVLKRLIISVTRIAKGQTSGYTHFSEDRMELIRQFSLLLEMNFRKEHEVKFYANALNRSPKTLSNLFCLCNYPSPSQIIRERIAMEAKRYALFTNHSAKEVAFRLGFESAAHFSHFFKQNTQKTYSEMRNYLT
ncbi:AraC-type DNA-binding protein [bacterium A37T11]|nr:AraC-type DNA-binding protein [bacterium A37T11]